MRPQHSKIPLGALLALLATAATVALAAVAAPRDYSVGKNTVNGKGEGKPTFLQLMRKEEEDVEIFKRKQPSTPPDQQDSDPFANYTYQGTFTSTRMQTNSPTPPKGRTIVIGDIHGSLAGFNGFLDAIKFESSKDDLILAGDLVAKGPQSLEVIDKANQLGASCVRGNHDDKVIRWKGYLDSLKPSERDSLPDLPSDLVENSDHHHIAAKMNDDQYQYMLGCPLILSLPSKLSAQKVPIHVIHAGVDPKRDLRKQLPWVLTNIRNVLDDGTPSRKHKHGDGWSDIFNELQSSKSKKNIEEYMVVYGHDAGRSLNVKTWTVGLDTGCVYGGSLSGYVVETGQVISVPCPDAPSDIDD
ncbi:hypothetical protein BGW38_003786 [Lunasporangiospora selenospora]|uniref:Calcineurin-like phosphoesterase domain-containing protein n=1 Tax=Lunasporangiospora selenospora TaxID=979761 RepID=A0A9P6KHT5_9FUNG|nr:hypothetical protein BGW38_003786 [Lunasporangiospora selenospora]